MTQRPPLTDLEQRLAQLQKAVVAKSVDEYVSDFQRRYLDEDPFREDVHKYFKISGWEKFRLGVVKTFSKKRYQARVDSMIRDYAMHVHEQLKELYELEQATLEKAKLEQEHEALKAALEEVKGEAQTATQQVQAVEQQRTEAVKRIEEDLTQKQQEVERTARERIEEVKQKTDPDLLVRAKVNDRLLKSASFKRGDRGELTFDESRIADNLEQFFLDDIVSTIEGPGQGRFLTKIKRQYKATKEEIYRYGPIRDLGELPRADWVATMITAAQNGRRYPTWDDIVVGKARAIGSGELPSAVCTDFSGSMTALRIKRAKETMLAVRGLMRSINPNCTTDLAIYNDGQVKPQTNVDLLKDVPAFGGTPTHLALKWMRETLHDGPGIAHLITDGAPDSIDACIKEAQQYVGRPLILTIYLIDGDGLTIETTKSVGLAAGPLTRVVPIPTDDLGTTVVRGVQDALLRGYRINDYARSNH